MRHKATKQYLIYSKKVLNQQLDFLREITNKSNNQILSDFIVPTVAILKTLPKPANYVVYPKDDCIEIRFVSYGKEAEVCHKPVRIYNGKNQALSGVIG